MAEDYLSIDPNAGLEDSGYISTDPNAGLETQEPSGFVKGLQTAQQALGVAQQGLMGLYTGAGPALNKLLFLKQHEWETRPIVSPETATGVVHAALTPLRTLEEVAFGDRGKQGAAMAEQFVGEQLAGFTSPESIALAAAGGIVGKMPRIREIAFGKPPEAPLVQPGEGGFYTRPTETARGIREGIEARTQSETVQPLTEEVVPKGGEINAEQIQGPARANVDVQLPGGEVAREVYGGEMSADVGGERVPPRGQGETLQQTPQEVAAPVPQPEQPTIYYHGTRGEFQGNAKTARTAEEISTGMYGKIKVVGSVFKGFFGAKDKGYAGLYAAGDESKIIPFTLASDAKVLKLPDIVSEEVLTSRGWGRAKELTSLPQPTKPFPFQQEFENYAFERLNTERTNRGAQPFTREQFDKRTKGEWNPTSENYDIEELASKYLPDYLQSQGYDAIEMGREIAVLNPEKVVTQKPPSQIPEGGEQQLPQVGRPEEPTTAAPTQIRAAVDRMDFVEQHTGASDLASDLEKVSDLPKPLKKALDDFREAQKVDREEFGERSGLVSEHGDILESEARKWASPESKAEVATTAETAEIDVSPLLKAKSEAEATPILGDLMIKAKTNADIAQIKSAYERWKSSPQAPKGGTGIPLEGQPKPTEVGPQVGRPEEGAAPITVFRGEAKGPSPAGQAHGVGTYYGLTENVAQRFSKKGTVKSEQVTLENPYIINSDAELRQIRESAGVESDPRMLLSKKDAAKFTTALQEQGHDGVIINYNEAPGGKQVVKFPSKTEPPPPAAPPPVETAAEPPIQKASKIGKSIEAKAVEAKLTEGFKDTALYDPITIKDQAERATRFVKESPTDARAVIRGDAALPEGLRGTSLITAMEEELIRKPDPKLAYELANSPLVSETSAAAQEMRLMSERVPDSITAKFNEIKEARKAGSKLRGETPEALFQDIRKEIVRQSSKRPTWEAFVREITC